ncbi:hypothetical protein AJ79_07729 [Helicocarpus griseus UAMH5409]|uniref:Uncharacterized protein n=1 Tax=Helicocarpus griseus UAMH5409 TaxID=1447875 RepID=A0A2B7X039_9EURO|nr:hypothetical protein AJ79_07729 [Helicocarpus griseus UAMH5409]
MTQTASAPGASPSGGINTVQKTHRSPYEIDKYWSSVVTQEPVSNELREMVRADLREARHIYREDKFRELLKHNWATVDCMKVLLNDTVGEVKPH